MRVLWHWRDGEAREWDRPAFHVMGNEDMVRLAEQSALGQPYSTPRMTSRRRKSFDIVLALAMQIPENEWPVPIKTRRSRPNRDIAVRFENLKKVRDKVAAELNLDPSIVAPRSALEAAAADVSTSALMEWQRNLLGLSPKAAHVA